ncbi:MAG: glycosyltransferase [Verrucomicrobia bacterium]|nr:glycosyltransferase [Verrucomicrobiota bacterium]MCH8512693.1 glycosyltransferase [Kiritimatiellia bacterium]
MHKSHQMVPDRRKRALSRPGTPDRRTHFRYAVDFPVKLIVGRGIQRQEILCKASDLSEGGIHLAHIHLPDGTDNIRLKFHVPENVLPEGYDNHTYHLKGTVQNRDDPHGELGVAFDEPLGRRLARGTWAVLRITAVLLAFVAFSLILLSKYDNLYDFWFDVPIFLYSICVGAYLLSRFIFAGFYRAPKPNEATPTMTVVIPAHNEETNIERTIREIMETRYPADKLQVVVVDDGSTDRTPERIEAARADYPELVSIRFETAQGKRQALAAGVRISKADLLVFIDSDSFLERDALTHIVRAFADPTVAAVTGHCDVENSHVNLITKMQAVRYYIGFRVMKAAESIFDSVTCLSGPFAAYRRSLVEERLDEWLDQKFLGIPATFGDDRSLTNALLRDGHRVLYDSRARCTTIVPESTRQFLRQQLRWKRSWFRESLRACGFMWRRQPFMALSFYTGFLLPLLGPAVVFRAMIFVPLFRLGTPFVYLLGILLMSMLMSSTYLFARKSRLWIYGVHFCFFYLLILIWQLPIAVLTFWKPDWGTRKGRI